MAVGKQQAGGADAQRGRRWIFGTNVAVMIAAAAAVLVVVNWLGQRVHVGVDLTATGANSVSQRTRRLLTDLKGTVRLTSLYMVTDLTPGEQKYLDRVQDLFWLYQRANPGKIEIENINQLKEQDKVARLLGRLKEKYQDESEKHRKLIDEFETLATELAKTFEEDRTAFRALFEANESLAKDPDFRNLSTHLFVQLAKGLQRAQANVRTFLELDISRYDRAVDEIKGEYEQVQQFLPQVVKWLRDKAVKLPGVDEDGRKIFEQIAGKYDTLIKKLEKGLEATQDLPKLELTEIAGKLKRRNIVVETEKRAKVIPFSDVWRRRQQDFMSMDREDPAHPEKTYTFHGEAAVSSAILQLTQAEKTAVVFVRFGGNSPITGGFQPPMGYSQPEYGIAARRLREANFVVQDWDLAAGDSLPTTDEKIKRRVFVLLHPEEARPNTRMPPQMRMPPPRFSAENAKTVREKIGESGRLVILAGYMRPRQRSMFMPRSSDKYEWADYLSKWGLRCRAQQFIIQGMSRAPGEWVRPSPVVTELDPLDHPIAKAIRGLPMAFAWSAPLEKMDPLPQGVTVTPLVRVAKTEDVWAVGDMSRLQRELNNGFYRKHEDDVASPLPVAMACTNEKGGKAVVVSSFEFAKDQWATAQAMLERGRYRIREPFPGNAELLLNAIFWLNDNENQIGAGPRSGSARRIGHIGASALTGWRWTAWAVWPFMALVAGTVVWFIRRR